ncbi:amidohydrolase family protein [Hyphococcus formosus]|uniref:amidohydrolase family protein n=1 Tax=Hyphococcus formosus TaxID=3143534 RepID=UPI00398BA3B2
MITASKFLSFYKLSILLLTALLSFSIAGAATPENQSGLALEPTRELSFEVDEGTWMSVNISPDGKVIVFDILGDLFTLPISGGEAKLLRGGMAYETQPAFSPDGKSIAFVSDISGSENIWIIAVDGSTARQISSSEDASHFTSPAWSADGKTIYASKRLGRHAPYQLWQFDVASGEGKKVFDDGSRDKFHALGAVASRDGWSLYFANLDTSAATLYSIPAWQIVRFNLETKKVTPVVTALSGAFRPQLSPNGEWLTYGTRFDGETGLRLRNLETGEDRWLAYPVQRDNRDASFNSDILPAYSFTSDSKYIVASIGGKLTKINVKSSKQKRIPFTADLDIEIATFDRPVKQVETGPVRARLVQDPVLSPDSKKIAFSAFAKLHLYDIASGVVEELNADTIGEFQPNWSPDGRWITYVTWDAKNGGAIWKKSAAGGKAQRLTPVGHFYSDPVFSPDGQWIYALSSNNHERMGLQEEVTPRRFSNLVKVPTNGGEPQVITHAGTGAERPFVTDNIERVFYTTPEGVKSVLASGNDGTGIDEKSHLRIDGRHAWTRAGSPYPVNNVVFSPDGKWLLTTSANQLFLAAIPDDTEETPVIDVFGAEDQQVKKISRFGADYYGWSKDGKAFYWAVGSSFYKLSVDDIKSLGAMPQTDADDVVEPIEIIVERPRDIPTGSTLLRGGTAITMRGDEIIENADILIRNNRIIAIGARDSFDVPEVDKTFDLDGAFITPGFVDTHAHWYEIRHDVLDLENWSFLISLAFGVTSGLDPQAMDQDMFAYQDLIDAGLMVGPRAWSVGQGMFPNTQIRSQQMADDLVKKYAEKYRTHNIKSYFIGDREQRQWMVQAADKYGVVVTTEGGDDYSLDITHAIDGFAGNEHTIPVVPLFDDVVRLLAETKIGYTPTLMIDPNGGGSTAKDYFFVTDPPHDNPKVSRFMPHYVKDTRASAAKWVRPEEQSFPQTAKAIRDIYRAGGVIGVGSHAEFQGLGYHWEMEALASGGLSPHEVLQAATRMGSEIIGRSADIGTLETGKLADLVILRDNPLADIKNARSIEYVIKNGRIYDGDTLNEIWPDKKKRSKAWHHEVLPE